MTRIELVNLFLTKEALYRLSYMGSKSRFKLTSIFNSNHHSSGDFKEVERETRLELATFSLEG
jgi:hypothetical protein